MNKGILEENRSLQRVITFLNRQQTDFLDKLGKDALFSSGFKIPRTRIIQVLVEILRKTNINLENINNVDELQTRIIEAIKNSEEICLRKGNSKVI